MASFTLALASMANYLDRPLWSDSISTSYGGGGWPGTSSSIDSFSSGGLPDRSLSSMLGFGGLSSRNFLRFGIASQIAGNVRASIPQGQFGMPDYVTSFLRGGIGMYGSSGAPGGFTPPPVAAPYFMPMQQPQQQSASYSPGATSVNIGTADNDEEPEAKPSISDDTVTKAETAIIDKGYGTGEARGIVEKVKAAAGGNEGKFKSIMEEAPRKSLTKEELDKIKPEEQQKAKDEHHKKWQHDFGEWYAHNIQGLDDKESTALVDRVAFGPGDGEIDIVRNEKSPGKNEGYKITNDPGFGEFKKDGFIYKKKGNTDNKWYSDKDCTKEIAGATSEGNNKVTVSASLEDYVDVKYTGKINDNGYEIYTVSNKSKTGAIGSPPNFYRDSSGKWYTKDNRDEYSSLSGTLDYKSDEGRIYFSRAPRSFRAEFYDTRQYIDALDKGLESYNADKETEKKIRKDRFEAFKNKVAGLLGGDKDKLSIAYDAEKGRVDIVDITVKPADAAAVRSALLKTTRDGYGAEVIFGAALNWLSPETAFQFNGATVGGNISNAIFSELKDLENAEKTKSTATAVKKKPTAESDKGQKKQASGTALKPPVGDADREMFVGNDLRSRLPAALRHLPSQDLENLPQTVSSPAPAVKGTSNPAPPARAPAAPAPAPRYAAAPAAPKPPPARAKTDPTAPLATARGSEMENGRPGLAASSATPAPVTSPRPEAKPEARPLGREAPRVATALAVDPAKGVDRKPASAAKPPSPSPRAHVEADPAISHLPRPAADAIRKMQRSLDDAMNPLRQFDTLKPPQPEAKPDTSPPPQAAAAKAKVGRLAPAAVAAAPAPTPGRAAPPPAAQAAAAPAPEPAPAASPAVAAAAPAAATHTPTVPTVGGDKITPPTDSILSTPYPIADQKVDLILPGEIKEKFDKAFDGDGKDKGIKTNAQEAAEKKIKGKPELNKVSVCRLELLKYVAQWALAHTRDWKGDTKKNPELLSLQEICKQKAGECTERTSFLYAVMMYAKDKLKGSPVEFGDESVDLEGITFSFAQIFDYPGEDHVCLKANVDGEVKFYDIAAPNVVKTGNTVVGDLTIVTHEYKKDQELGIPEYVAMLLCNKGRSLTVSRKGSVPEANVIYRDALSLTDKTAYVLADAAIHFYNTGVFYRNKGDHGTARKYFKEAADIVKKLPKSNGYAFIQNRKNLKQMSGGLAKYNRPTSSSGV